MKLRWFRRSNMYKFDLQIRSIQDLFTSKFEAPQNNQDALNTLYEKIN